MSSSGTLALCMVATGISGMAYYALKHRRIIDEYYSLTADPALSAVQPVGRMRLYYGGTSSAEDGAPASQFTEAKASDKAAREQAIVRFVRLLIAMHSVGKAPFVLTEEENSDGDESIWWQHRYHITSLFEGLGDLRWLPVSFILGGCADFANASYTQGVAGDSADPYAADYFGGDAADIVGSGSASLPTIREARTWLGAVRELYIESDMGLGGNATVEKASLRLIFRLVDTDWRNPLSQASMTDSPFVLVVTQNAEQEVTVEAYSNDAFANVAGGLGGLPEHASAVATPLSLAVSNFAFQLHESPVSYSSKVRHSFLVNGPVYANNDSAGEDEDGGTTSQDLGRGVMTRVVVLENSREQQITFLGRALLRLFGTDMGRLDLWLEDGTVETLVLPRKAEGGQTGGAAAVASVVPLAVQIGADATSLRAVEALRFVTLGDSRGTPDSVWDPNQIEEVGFIYAEPGVGLQELFFMRTSAEGPVWATRRVVRGGGWGSYLYNEDADKIADGSDVNVFLFSDPDGVPLLVASAAASGSTFVVPGDSDSSSSSASASDSASASAGIPNSDGFFAEFKPRRNNQWQSYDARLYNRNHVRYPSMSVYELDSRPAKSMNAIWERQPDTGRKQAYWFGIVALLLLVGLFWLKRDPVVNPRWPSIVACLICALCGLCLLLFGMFLLFMDSIAARATSGDSSSASASASASSMEDFYPELVLAAVHRADLIAFHVCFLALFVALLYQFVFARHVGLPSGPVVVAVFYIFMGLIMVRLLRLGDGGHGSTSGNASAEASASAVAEGRRRLVEEGTYVRHHLGMQVVTMGLASFVLANEILSARKAFAIELRNPYRPRCGGEPGSNLRFVLLLLGVPLLYWAVTGGWDLSCERLQHRADLARAQGSNSDPGWFFSDRDILTCTYDDSTRSNFVLACVVLVLGAVMWACAPFAGLVDVHRPLKHIEHVDPWLPRVDPDGYARGGLGGVVRFTLDTLAPMVVVAVIANLLVRETGVLGGALAPKECTALRSAAEAYRGLIHASHVDSIRGGELESSNGVTVADLDLLFDAEAKQRQILQDFDSFECMPSASIALVTSLVVFKAVWAFAHAAQGAQRGYNPRNYASMFSTLCFVFYIAVLAYVALWLDSEDRRLRIIDLHPSQFANWLMNGLVYPLPPRVLLDELADAEADQRARLIARDKSQDRVQESVSEASESSTGESSTRAQGTAKSSSLTSRDASSATSTKSKSKKSSRSSLTYYNTSDPAREKSKKSSTSSENLSPSGAGSESAEEELVSGDEEEFEDEVEAANSGSKE